MKKYSKSKNVIFRCISDYFRAHPIALIISFFCVFISCLGTIIGPVMIQNITGLIENGIKNGWDSIANDFTLDVVILISSYVVALAGGFTYSQVTAIYGQIYMHDIRQRAFDHLESLPISYFDRNEKGEIMSTFTNDIDTIRQLLTQSIVTVLICTVSFISVFVIMSMSSLYLTIIVLVGTIIMLLVSKKVGGKSAKNFMMNQKILAKEEGFIEEVMNGLKVVKSFTHEEESIKDLEVQINDLQEVATKANKYANILMPIMNNIGNFLYVIVAVVGVLLFIFKVPSLTITGYYPNDTIGTGVIVSFLPMVRMFTQNVSEVSNQINPIASAIGGCTRVYEIIDKESETDDGYVSLVMGKKDENGNIIECDRKEHTLWAWKHPHQDGTLTYTELEGDIRMFDVDFGYVENKIVLHDVSLFAKPGQKIAFVGATGAGKTTITNLINRFYDIADGKIRYDGININKIKKKDLRRSLGMVLQDTNLFTGTIMDNIRYGRLDATDEECIEAAKLANADSFIQRLPHGYNTVIKGNGSGISQGQAQLLSIARAAVSDCPVMILDEATSSIDTRTEKIVLEGMQNLMKGRTVFLIAHRLSTIKDAEAIMVLDHGNIIERGTHEQLIDLHGYYYQLYTGVFELE